jgi:hypothetical protein
MRKLVWVPFLFLLACAPERKPTDFRQGEDRESQGQCSRSYAPLPLLREGLPRILDPNHLPAGSYNYIYGEVFVSAEVESDFRAHFSEEFRMGGVLNRMICASQLPPRTFVEVDFPAVLTISVEEAEDGLKRSYLPATLAIQGEGSRVRLTRLAGQPREGGIQAILQRWADWRIYKTGSLQYELRAHTIDMSDGVLVHKRMVLRFEYSPPSDP